MADKEYYLTVIQPEVDRIAAEFYPAWDAVWKQTMGAVELDSITTEQAEKNMAELEEMYIRLQKEISILPQAGHWFAAILCIISR
ncbi:hypothetical protein [Planococcus lenghuensis]|uniref:Uncharacterized protein n=1 Tax=Planococcus lenghuensis TaxID=2213202 RepID=A0A1Q2KZF4_9BACL|nr:hypothetical protein [Planococcus lenghuensis]AQQ53526.1 hypothetical protein B0X71_10885 [Planococcus lenghuensis]